MELPPDDERKAVKDYKHYTPIYLPTYLPYFEKEIKHTLAHAISTPTNKYASHTTASQNLHAKIPHNGPFHTLLSKETNR